MENIIKFNNSSGWNKSRGGGEIFVGVRSRGIIVADGKSRPIINK